MQRTRICSSCFIGLLIAPFHYYVPYLEGLHHVKDFKYLLLKYVGINNFSHKYLTVLERNTLLMLFDGNGGTFDKTWRAGSYTFQIVAEDVRGRTSVVTTSYKCGKLGEIFRKRRFRNRNKFRPAVMKRAIEIER